MATKDRELTTPEAAAFLGVTEQALRMKVRRRQVPFEREGRRLIFTTRTLEQHLRATRDNRQRFVARGRDGVYREATK